MLSTAAVIIALASPQDSVADRLGADLTPFLSAEAQAGRFSGVVLVARGGRPIYSAAYGLADRARRVPNTLDTRFNLGSINKTWTAIAVAQLVEAGRIDLEAPVGRYLPDLPNAAVRDQVLIRHLLTHTSGLGDYFGPKFIGGKVYVERMTDFLPYYISDSLEFAPGARMAYSNAGFALLGLIVERVSGQSYYDYIQAHILDRAGMRRALFADLRQKPRSVAVGYAQPEGSTAAVENWDFLEQHSSPAGGAYAAAADLVAFGQALRNGTLASPATIETFTTGKVPMGGIKYAYGFGDGRVHGHRFVGHNGGAPGANAEFMSFPDLDIDIVILANQDPPAATEVVFRAARIVTGAPPKQP